MVGSDGIRKNNWLLLAFLITSMVFGPSRLAYFWPAFLFLSSLAILWTLYLIYVCEKFTLYMTSFLITIIGSFSMFSGCGAYWAAARFWGYSSISAFAVGLAPIAIACLTYWALVTGKQSFHPFEYDGNKVQVKPQKKQKISRSSQPLWLGAVIVLGINVFTGILGRDIAGLVGIVGMGVWAVILMFLLRHVLRGLRALQAQEKNMPVPYTFMNIDAIREARSHWWMSRLFKWVASKGKSSTV